MLCLAFGFKAEAKLRKRKREKERGGGGGECEKIFVFWGSLFIWKPYQRLHRTAIGHYLHTMYKNVVYFLCNMNNL